MRRSEARQQKVAAAVSDVAGTFQLVLVSTAEKPVSPPVRTDIEGALDEVNGQNVPIAHFQSFDQRRLYQALLQSVEQKGIDLTITLHEWGMVTEPYRVITAKLKLVTFWTGENTGHVC